VRVLIADDHRLILEGIRRALEEADDIEIVGQAETGTEVVPLVARTKPDVAMLDLRMPGMDGLACLDRIRARHPEVKVVILSVSTDPELIRTVLSRGASAYIVKSVNPSDLPAALRQVMEGTFFSLAGLPESAHETAAGKEAGLTEREIAILKAVAQGMSNDAIAKQLWIAQQTVKFHLTNIYRKLDVANRTEATRTSTASSRARCSTTPSGASGWT
jgi:DNA-binding NarL/FixJ family response regulator